VIKYAITDPSFFNPLNKRDYLRYKEADFLLFRDKTTNSYNTLAKAFLENSQNLNAKRLLHQDFLLAKSLNAYGVHLTSNQFNSIKRAKDLGLFVVVSTHSIAEAKRAKELGANAITFSPIFSTPNKGKPKGVEELKKVVKCCNIKVIALGGIVTNEHIKKIEASNAWGFASIRYFK